MAKLNRPCHYIEALFKKITYPHIEVFLKVTKTEVYNGKYKVDFNMYFFNWTPLQNEEKLSFRVVTEGIFGRSQYPQFNHLYAMEWHEYYKENVKDIFYFGEPILESEVIMFDPHKAAQQGNKSQLTISFGGKLSPRKSSEYYLDFAKMYSKNANEIVIIKSENKLTKAKVQVINQVLQSRNRLYFHFIKRMIGR